MLVLLAAALFPSAGRAGLRWGRPTEDHLTGWVAGTAGRITSLKGSVQETTRPFYDLTEPDKNTQFAESYTLEELGFDGGYSTFGLAFEKAWSFFTFQANLSYLNPFVRSEAVRDYYIGVQEVSFNGKKYEYMNIPEGTPFTAEMEGGTFGMRGMLTPVSLTGGNVLEITPSIGLGLNAFFSFFEIDAGPAQGVVLYEIPPHEYVVGGHGRGWSGMVLPELGAAVEIRLRTGNEKWMGPELILQGYYALFDFSGSTEDLGITSSRNAKVLGLEYDHYEARALLSLPVLKAVELLIGVGVQHMRADAEILAEDRPAEEVEERREKFNKFVHLEMTSVMFFAGLRF